MAVIKRLTLKDAPTRLSERKVIDLMSTLIHFVEESPARRSAPIRTNTASIQPLEVDSNLSWSVHV